MAGDKGREAVKEKTEWWKEQSRDKLGENTASQLTNGLVNLASETGDLAMLGGDTAFDLIAALATCATGDSYCSQAKSDIAKKDAAAANVLNGIMNGDAWDGMKSTAIKAANGEQKALENVAGVLSSAFVPAKILPGGKLTGATSAAQHLDELVPSSAGKTDSGKGIPSTPEKLAGPTEKWKNYTHAEAIAQTASSGKMANADKAIIDVNKLTSYALNTEHPVGGNKAKVFESALGYNQSNVADLITKVQDGVKNNPVKMLSSDKYGQRMAVEMPITGPNGQTAIVRTGWIYDAGSSVPGLTTIYVN